jgi:hypothetical protein
MTIEQDVLGILTTESLFLNQAPGTDALGESRIAMHELVNGSCKDIADILVSSVIKTDTPEYNGPINIDQLNLLPAHTKETFLSLIPHFKALKNVVEICKHPDLSWIRAYTLTFMDQIWNQLEANEPILVIISTLCSMRYWLNALIVQHYHILRTDG